MVSHFRLPWRQNLCGSQRGLVALRVHGAGAVVCDLDRLGAGVLHDERRAREPAVQLVHDDVRLQRGGLAELDDGQLDRLLVHARVERLLQKTVGSRRVHHHRGDARFGRPVLEHHAWCVMCHVSCVMCEDSGGLGLSV